MLAARRWLLDARRWLLDEYRALAAGCYEPAAGFVCLQAINTRTFMHSNDDVRCGSPNPPGTRRTVANHLAFYEH